MSGREYSNAADRGRPEQVLAEARSHLEHFASLPPEEQERRARLAKMRADSDARERHLAEVTTREADA